MLKVVMEPPPTSPYRSGTQVQPVPATSRPRVPDQLMSRERRPACPSYSCPVAFERRHYVSMGLPAEITLDRQPTAATDSPTALRHPIAARNSRPLRSAGRDTQFVRRQPGPLDAVG